MLRPSLRWARVAVVSLAGGSSAACCSAADGSHVIDGGPVPFGDGEAAARDAAPGEGGVRDASAPGCQGASLTSEAGFFEVPAQPSGANYAARMFYDFQPAQGASACKPLFVVFNGGPGFATTSGLLAYGTGPTTLVDGAPAGAPPQPNAATFTRFANMLYLDERATGFSYPLSAAGGAAPDFGCAFSIVGDAGDFAVSLLSFLGTHPGLQRAPIFFLGESYGGTRATTLLHLFLHATDESLAISGSLRAGIAAHFQQAFPGAPQPISPERAANQFQGLVLIQPLVAGAAQFAAQAQLLPQDPYVGSLFRNTAYDPYDLAKPAGWSDALDVRADHALADPGASRALLGTDLAGIAGIEPKARAAAYRNGPFSTSAVAAADRAASAALTQQLGALGSNDYYLATESRSCDDAKSVENDQTVGNWFLDDLYLTRIFLTHARWDGTIYSPAIPYLFQQAGFPTTVDSAPRAGFARPGWIELALPQTSSQPSRKVELRYPEYVASGHMVAVTQGPDLASDVEQWLSVAR